MEKGGRGLGFSKGGGWNQIWQGILNLDLGIWSRRNLGEDSRPGSRTLLACLRSTRVGWGRGPGFHRHASAPFCMVWKHANPRHLPGHLQVEKNQTEKAKDGWKSPIMSYLRRGHQVSQWKIYGQFAWTSTRYKILSNL